MLQLQAKGQRVARLENRPKLNDGLGVVSANPYIQAYQVLSRSRQIGMAEFYIPLTEIMAYLDLIQLNDPVEREDFALIVMAIDSAMLAHKSEKDKQNESRRS